MADPATTNPAPGERVLGTSKLEEKSGKGDPLGAGRSAGYRLLGITVLGWSIT